MKERPPPLEAPPPAFPYSSADGKLPPGTPTCVFSWGLATSGRLGFSLLQRPAAARQCSWSDEPEDVLWSASGGADRLDRSCHFLYDAADEQAYLALPRRVGSLDRVHVSQIAAGEAHSFATTTAGVTYGWGVATDGRLGVGREDTLPIDEDGAIYVECPMLLLGLKGYQVGAVATSEKQSVACTVDGQMLTWGTTANGCHAFDERGGALQMPTEVDGSSYMPLPRQIWVPLQLTAAPESTAALKC